MWFAASPGLVGFLALRLAVLLLSVSMMLLKRVRQRYLLKIAVKRAKNALLHHSLMVILTPAVW